MVRCSSVLFWHLSNNLCLLPVKYIVTLHDVIVTKSILDITNLQYVTSHSSSSVSQHPQLSHMFLLCNSTNQQREKIICLIGSHMAYGCHTAYGCHICNYVLMNMQPLPTNLPGKFKVVHARWSIQDMQLWMPSEAINAFSYRASREARPCILPDI